ncbi:MAG: acyltransferase family protein, partial [Rhodospirillales bacterium]|nr:acyltransferase family protein [Rhodospirillales bacterium]
MQGNHSGGGRIVTIDVARFYGIVLVYYGHVVERFMYLQIPAGAHHYKFVYSFHMLLFFILAGFIAKESVQDLPVKEFIKTRLASRFVPLLFFNFLLALGSLVLARDFPPMPLDTPAQYLSALKTTLTVLPVFNIPTWFLMCLITVEVLHYLLFRLMRKSDALILLAAVVCFLGGFYLNRQILFFDIAGGAMINHWFYNEAPVVYAFYLLGVLARRRGIVTVDAGRGVLAIAAVAAIAGVYLTYDLNQGPFNLIPAVVIVASGHGHILWFPLTAIIGSAMILLLARLTPPARWMEFMGRNALSLFCLNGIFYHHVNGPFAAWVKGQYGDS